MDRARRFRDLFDVSGKAPDPVQIPALMRFGGFTEKDTYLVETAVRLSPDKFRTSFSEPDPGRAYQAACDLQIPGIVPIVSDMRAALGLARIRSPDKEADRKELFERMISDLGRSSLTDGSMSGRGFLAEDVLMVSYIARCSRRNLDTMAWDPNPEAARRAALAIAESTSLDSTAVLSLMEDIRSEKVVLPQAPTDPGLLFKKSRPSEARLVRYSGSENRVEIPSETTVGGVRLKVTSISDSAFARNTELMEVVIPGSVRSIGRYAFFGCTALTSVDMDEGLRIIGPGAFCKCSSLETADLPKGLESIGDQAFLGCSIEEMFVPDTVTSVGRHAFPHDCKLIGKNVRQQQ